LYVNTTAITLAIIPSPCDDEIHIFFIVFLICRLLVYALLVYRHLSLPGGAYRDGRTQAFNRVVRYAHQLMASWRLFPTIP
jgi:hypothetical protein